MVTDLFTKCATERVRKVHIAESLGMLPYFREMASGAGPEVIHDGRPVIMLGSNNYLGLTADARVKRAAIEAVERYGTGCTGSRLMNGTLDLHRQLEEEIADWLGGEDCLVFTTGYAVNLGVVSALIGPADRVVLDASAHASMFDGAGLASGSVRIFRHNSAAALRRRLEAWQASAGDGAGGVLVGIDGVYSMEGDQAPVAEVAAVCKELGARLIVDEAHSLGVVGPEGAGVAAAAGVQADLVMGTFSKSLASCGGFLLGSKDVMDFFRYECRPFLFTASGVPAALAAALAATRIARAEDWRREAVVALAGRLRDGLHDLGYNAGGAGAAIVPVHIGGDFECARVWNALLNAGVYTNCAIAPAVPEDKALLRTSVMATHTEEQIDRALDAFASARNVA